MGKKVNVFIFIIIVCVISLLLTAPDETFSQEVFPTPTNEVFTSPLDQPRLFEFAIYLPFVRGN